MNKINPKKLLRSKWTAVAPLQKEKHFMVTEVEFDDDGEVIECVLEAVMSNRASAISWHDLKDENNWVHGWQ